MPEPRSDADVVLAVLDGSERDLAGRLELRPSAFQVRFGSRPRVVEDAVRRLQPVLAVAAPLPS